MSAWPVPMALAWLGVFTASVRAGPDVTASDVATLLRGGGATGYSTYSFGATQCNLGDSPLPALFNSHHPVYAANLYRLLNGRFEQIGMGWPVHTLCPLQQPCTTCIPPGGSTCDALGIGCSSSDSASYAGNRGSMGARSEINVFTGVFPYPYAPPSIAFPSGRVRVDHNDLDPALNPGALYFVELQFVSPDDAAAENSLNNSSYRRVQVGPYTGGGYSLSLAEATVTQTVGLAAWPAHTPGVVLANGDVPADGRFILGCRVEPLGNGYWRYEYALLNLNSDRGAGSFAVPVPPETVSLNNIAFHDVDYHSGELYSGTDWPFARDTGPTSDVLVWSTERFADNPNANALRWGTVYNFRFDADSPPTAGEVTVGLFKPGPDASITIAARVPSIPCPADFNRNGAADIGDVFAMLAAWFVHDPRADWNGDTVFAIGDFFAFLAAWFAGCP